MCVLFLVYYYYYYYCFRGIMKTESLIVEDVHSLSIMDLLRSQHFSGDLVSIGCQVDLGNNYRHDFGSWVLTQ